MVNQNENNLTEPSVAPAPIRLAVALQGGGTHGAFTWGALRALTEYWEKNKLDIVAVTGTSAGAVNACALAAGWADAAPGKKAENADCMLERVWFGIDRLMDVWNNTRRLMSDTVRWMFNPLSFGSRDFSTHPPRHQHPALPPLNYKKHPIEWLVNKLGLIQMLNKPGAPQVFVNAVNHETGANTVFTGPALTAEAVGGSGTLPQMFEATEIDSRRYWDGGFIGNPPLRPLIEHCEGITDIFCVRITPLKNRYSANMTRQDHDNRIAELMLNAAWEAELGMLRLLKPEIRLHMIEVPERWTYPLTSKVDLHSCNWEFFSELRDAGEGAARQWIRKNDAQWRSASTYEPASQTFGAVQPVQTAKSRNPKLDAA